MIPFAILSYLMILLTILFLHTTIQQINPSEMLQKRFYGGLFVLVVFAVFWLSAYLFL